MSATTRVNLHCHTAFSDGALSPEEVVERLAGAGVAVAALTDHDTVDGLERFQQALARRGMGFISGLEMTTHCGEAEAHLLAYGFDPAHGELLATLASIRRARVVGVESITSSMRQYGASGGDTARSAAADGRISTQDAISLVHRAGGIAVLAHPLFLEPNPAKLRQLLAELRERGLDGAEAIYAKFDGRQQQVLCDIADDLGLLVSAGTDFHAPGDAAPGIDMPAQRWKRFRNAIRPSPAAGIAAHASQRSRRRHYVLHILSPIILATALLVLAMVVPRGAVAVLAAVVLLLLYVMRQSLGLERQRREAEDHLQETGERYRSLVEAATEGTLLVLGGRCRYANPILLRMLGYAQQELDLLDPADLIPAGQDNEVAWASIRRLEKGEEVTGGFEGALRHRDGSRVDCIMALSRISFGGRDGFILLAREARSHFAGGIEENPERWHRLAKVAEGMPIALFRARAVRWGAIVDANREAAELFGPVQEGSKELGRSLADLFGGEDEYAEFVKELETHGRAERRLRVAGQGEGMRVMLLRAALRREESGAESSIDGVVQDITALVSREAEREAIIQRLQTSLLFLHEPVRQLSRPAVSCGADTPIDDAAAVMAANASTCILVCESGREIGIVTDRDLRDRVLAAGLAAEEPVRRIMTSPLLTIPERAQIYEAMLAMQQRNVQHLAIVDEAGRVAGVVRGRELLQFPGYGAIVVTREIAGAESAEAVALCCRRVPGLARTLFNCGAHPRNITRMLASVCDAATARLVSLAEAELGPAPAAFAFVALGSQGRQEQTLFTDQDNAIIHAASADGDPDAAGGYFRELGARVCAWLDAAGYAFCRGEIMARNPKWVRPLAAWKQYFDGWISRAEPQELLEFCIFFDLRSVCGDAGLVRELREHVRASLGARPEFFPHFAQNALQFKPPVRLFGKLIGAGETAGVNLKDAMMPIVNFARLYALKHEVNETHTLDRLDRLADAEVLAGGSRDEIAGAYDFLMRLRLGRQLAAIQAGESPDNTINHGKLGHLDEAMLKQSFMQIDAVQHRISAEFLGGR